MTSQQRQNATHVLREFGPLPPRALATQLGISPEAARQLIRRMLADGELRREDGSYALAEGGAEAVHICQPDDAGESHGATPERHDVTEESNAYSPSGVWETDAAGRTVPWVPPYPPPY